MDDESAEWSRRRMDEGVLRGAINEKNILLRECRLKNTEYIYGLVINTGPDTKVMKSTTESPRKISDLDRTLNKVLKLFLGIMIVMCLIGAFKALAENDAKNRFIKYNFKPTKMKK